MHVVSIVLTHQARRQVDTDHLRRTLVDIFHERGEAAHERFVQPRAEEPVHDDRLRCELRRVKVERDLRELYLALLDKLFAVGLAVIRQLIVNIKQVNRHLVTGIRQEARYGERVAAVVARAGKDDHRSLVAPLLHDGGSEDLGGTFHEVNTLHWFVLYRILVKLMYLSSSKNLHITAKVLKRMENKGKSYGYFS